MGKTTITKLDCRQVFSNRGHPAIEVKITTENGKHGTAACTAGITVGTHEIDFTYDGGTLWEGKGMTCVVDAIVDVIAPEIIGIEADLQSVVDDIIIKNVKKAKIGGNGSAAISAAVLKAGANALGIPLYRHIGGIDAITIPLASYGCYFGSNRYHSTDKAGVKPTCSFVAYDFKSYSEAVEALFHLSVKWKELAFRKLGLISSCDGGNSLAAGFILVPPGIIKSDETLWHLLADVIEYCGYKDKIGLQIDVAADSFYNKKTKLYEGLFSPGNKSREEIIDITLDLVKQYPFVIIEDPLHEDDYEGHAKLTQLTGVQIVGDDLFTTDSKRVIHGASLAAANTVLMKVNQIGTITEAMQMVQTAYNLGYGVMPCNSRGEGIDIVDYSVGINAGTIRESSLGLIGSRLQQIEKELGNRAKYLGKKALKGWRFGI